MQELPQQRPDFLQGSGIELSKRLYAASRWATDSPLAGPRGTIHDSVNPCCCPTDYLGTQLPGTAQI